MNRSVKKWSAQEQEMLSGLEVRFNDLNETGLTILRAFVECLLRNELPSSGFGFMRQYEHDVRDFAEELGIELVC